MATNAQIEANRRNSHSSTGPRTESGKAASSRNRLTYGLYTHADYVTPDEAEIYAEFCKAMYDQLTPGNLLEETFAAEITGASWRLRRCAAAEADLADYREQDPLLDDATDKTRRGIERARATAHSVIQRSLNQLRKLQTERIIRENLNYGGKNRNIAAESLKLVAAQRADDKVKEREAQQQSSNIVDALENMRFPSLDPTADIGELASNCNAADPVDETLASNCEMAEMAEMAALMDELTARNLPCSCNSGEIKRLCCGKNEPSPLEKAA